MDSLPVGWSIEEITVVGPRRRIGDRHFVFGSSPPPGLAAGRLPVTREPFIAVGTGGGYLIFYTDFLTDAPRELTPKRVGNLGEREPIGNWERAHNQFYPTIYPIAGGDLFHIVAGRSSGRSPQLEYCRKLDDSADLAFWWNVPFLEVDGKPAAIDWNRKGRYDLIVGEPDGKLRRYRRKIKSKGFAFEEPGEPVLAGDCPIAFGDWAYPAVVDWDAAGRSDLLVGTAAGEAWLFRDIGGRDAVRYDRGRAIRTRDGRLSVGSFAAPAPLVDAAGRFTHLLVMSGRGELFAFEMRTVTTYVTSDLAKAFGEQNGKITSRYRKGFWWLRKRFAETRSRQLLTTCRQCRPRDFTEGLTFDDLVENVAPEIELPRPVRGHCEVHVGLYRPASLPFTCAPGEIPSQVPAGRLQVRTEAEATGELVCPDEMSDLPCQEVFIGVKDLGKGSLFLSQGRGGYKRHGGYPCYLDYIRLVPVRPPRRRPRRDRRVVSGIFDAFCWTTIESTNTRASIENVVDKHAACGFNRIYYKAGGGGWEYPSSVPGAEPVTDYPGSKTPQRWPREDFPSHVTEINRLQIAAEACRERGIECYAWARITNQGEHIGAGWYIDRFFVERPELRDQYRHGQPKWAISLAHPEAREYLLSLFAEQISYGVDGLLIDFLRTAPTLVFPEPLVEEFRKRHGVDPRTRPPEDPRILRLQARYVTDFLRALKRLPGRGGRPPRLHVRIDSLELRKGWAPRAWIEKGLLDAVIIEHTDAMDPDEPPDLPALLDLCRGTPCEVIAGFYRPYWGKDHAHAIHEEVVRQQAEKYFAMGADGVSFYETAVVLRFPRIRQAIRRLRSPETPATVLNT